MEGPVCDRGSELEVVIDTTLTFPLSLLPVPLRSLKYLYLETLRTVWSRVCLRHLYPFIIGDQ